MPRMRVITYIDKLSGEDLQDAFAYSLFAMSNEQLQDVLETVPSSERQRLFECLKTADRLEEIRTKYEQACRKEDSQTTIEA